MKNNLKRFGFTLMEVNLAIFIMAAGVLAMVSLYPLGYRESEQSREDVVGTVYADAILNPLVAALSSRQTTWNSWHSAVQSAVGAFSGEDGGWMKYCESGSFSPKKRGTINSLAQSTFNTLAGAASGNQKPQFPSVQDGIVVALVAQWGRKADATSYGCQFLEDHTRVALSFRCAHNPSSLFAAPIYYTEVHFQGDQGGLE